MTVGQKFWPILLGASCFASPITFTDGDFPTASWINNVLVYDDPTVPGPPPLASTGSVARVDIGGNPGPYRQHTHTTTYGDTIYTSGLNTAAIYDPSVSGAIGTINFSVDLLHPPTGSSAWQLMIEQGGVRYYSVPLMAFTCCGWQHHVWTGLSQANFDTNPTALFLGEPPNGLHPDFSSAGAEITFGYALGNRLTGPGTLTHALGVDNWSVSINPVPEPATIQFAAMGLVATGVLIFIRRRFGKL